MPSVATLTTTLQTLLRDDATRLADQTHAVQRPGKFTGETLAQTLVWGWLDRPDASLADLCGTAAALGVTITPQGLSKRFHARTASFLRALLDQATDICLDAACPAVPVLETFSHVYLDDSTVITLPDSLAAVWTGLGGAHGSAAAVRLQVRLDLARGRLIGPALQDGRTHDKQGPQHDWPLESDAIRIMDLGYVNLERFGQEAHAGDPWLSRYPPQAAVQDATGQWWNPTDLPTLVAGLAEGETCSLAVRVGKAARVPCRLLVQRVPAPVAAARRARLLARAERKRQPVSPVSLALADWTLLLTTVPAERLSVPAAVALYRARWQIEMLFKRWKSGQLIDEWRSANPQRILAELYAKLLGCLIQHWLLLEPCWQQTQRSLVRAVATVRRYVLALATTLSSRTAFARTVHALRRSLAALPSTNRRRKRPGTDQLLLAVPSQG
jgi:hypothetical protein